MEPTPKDGLFREFFSKPIDIPNDKYHTLDIESMYYTTYNELIEVFDFEFKLRERIVMNVEEDRIGEWN